MPLLVEDWIPPDIQHAVSPLAASDEEGAQVEAAAILGNDEVDAFGSSISDGGKGYRIEVVFEVRRV